MKNLNMIKQKERTESEKYLFIRGLLLGSFAVFFVSFVMFYRQMGMYFDMSIHANMAVNFSWKELIGMGYPGWHLLVRLFTNGFGFPVDISAAFVTSISNVFTFILCSVVFFFYYLKDISISENQEKDVFILLFFVMMAGPLYFPRFNSNIYLGQGTPNVWHNPTNLSVRPFAILSLYLMAVILDDEVLDYRKVITFSIALAASCLFKPSFALAFGLANGICLLIKLLRKEISSHKFLMICVSMLPALFIMAVQYAIQFRASAGSGIEIAPFDVMGATTPNIVISFLLAFAFPLYVTVVCYKRIKNDNAFILNLLFFIVAYMEYAFVAESGPRKYDGNFSWSYGLSIFLVFYSGFSMFYKYSCEEWKDHRLVCLAGWGIFACHVLIGIYYYFHLLIAGGGC